MDCYLCDQEATQRCSRCGNPYCDDHGEDPSAGSPAGEARQALCADCLSPVSAAPSGTVFRASLLALLVGSVLALWLLIRPPGLPGESSEVVVPNASPAASPEPISPSPIPTGTAEPTPEPTEEPTAEPTEEPTPIEYTVVENDSWCGIAEAFDVDAAALAAANGFTLDDPVVIGDPLTIPRDLPDFTEASCFPQ